MGAESSDRVCESEITRCGMTRERLANRRASMTFTLQVGGLSYTCSYSRLPDGRVAEVFLSNHKTNSGADVAARDSAIA